MSKPKRDKLNQPYDWQGQTMPSLWPHILPEDVIDGYVPEERDATCTHCPKVVTCGYDPQMRCCTYFPRVPNYALGLALKGGGDSAAAVREIIAAGWATPEGFHETPAIWLRSLSQWRDEAFGKTNDVTCPFLSLEQKGCRIHPYRNAVCATFFCRNEHGRMGKEFWESLEDLGVQSEAALGQWAMTQNGYPVASYFERLGTLADQDFNQLCRLPSGAWTEEALAQLWGDARVSPEDYFLACADAVIARLDDIQTILNETKLEIPTRFEQAMLDHVPKDLKEYVPTDRLAEGKPATIEDLAYKAKLAQRNLNLLPEQNALLQINPDLKIEQNDGASDLEQHYSDYPWRLSWQSRHLDDDVFVTAAEGKALKHLAESPLRLDDKLFARWQSYGIDIPQRFLSKALGKGIIETITEH